MGLRRLARADFVRARGAQNSPGILRCWIREAWRFACSIPANPRTPRLRAGGDPIVAPIARTDEVARQKSLPGLPQGSLAVGAASQTRHLTPFDHGGDCDRPLIYRRDEPSRATKPNMRRRRPRARRGCRRARCCVPDLCRHSPRISPRHLGSATSVVSQPRRRRHRVRVCSGSFSRISSAARRGAAPHASALT